MRRYMVLVILICAVSLASMAQVQATEPTVSPESGAVGYWLQATATEIPTAWGTWKVRWDAIGAASEWVYVVFRWDEDAQAWAPVKLVQGNRWVDRGVRPYTSPKYRVYAIHE